MHIDPRIVPLRASAQGIDLGESENYPRRSYLPKVAARLTPTKTGLLDLYSLNEKCVMQVAQPAGSKEVGFLF